MKVLEGSSFGHEVIAACRIRLIAKERLCAWADVHDGIWKTAEFEMIALFVVRVD